jgi:hypothetical protein
MRMTFKDLKDELLYVHPVRDDDGRGLIWTDVPDNAQDVAAPPAQTIQQPTVQVQPSPQAEPLPTAPLPVRNDDN